MIYPEDVKAMFRERILHKFENDRRQPVIALSKPKRVQNGQAFWLHLGNVGKPGQYCIDFAKAVLDDDWGDSFCLSEYTTHQSGIAKNRKVYKKFCKRIEDL